ncbi:DUF6084 family protein [Asanoa iriomotensis]|uniref:Uncharacterized protein n=1 Tax=Asanoa iriomotensis TaxID=234613 RepID=A0ABQ4C1X4_9ACTN|nr:DUF6084 family protein [Asanoa iriomotensis]GIF56739.1 hypothetical protein Air01nite_28340 [Asanoa iriomotensis]
MTLLFAVRDIVAEPHAVTPQLTAKLRIDDDAGRRVHAMTLRCQVRVEPQRRGYDPAEGEALRGLFGGRERWTDTVRPFPWLRCDTTVPGFAGGTEVDLALPCTYDLDVVGTSYLHALTDGTVPLSFLFSGTVFVPGGTGFAVEPVPWDRTAAYDLPVAVWRDMIEQYFPGTGWLRLDREVLDALAALRARQGHVSWEETIRSLLPADEVVA